jgi:hypothetical protein
MKLVSTVLVSLATAAVMASCSEPKDRYVDLSTGEPVVLVKDESTGLMVNAETKKPLRIYVDTKTNDTIWGKTGAVINGSLLKEGEVYVYVNDEDRKVKTDEDGSYKIKDGDYKKKVDEDGDIKIKDGDTKIKIDAQTGKTKVKKD